MKVLQHFAEENYAGIGEDHVCSVCDDGGREVGDGEGKAGNEGDEDDGREDEEGGSIYQGWGTEGRGGDLGGEEGLDVGGKGALR